jgi:hypothetical protein
VHGGQHFRVAAHSEIVIRAPHGHPLFDRGGVSTGEFLGETIDVVEVAVGLVLVFLLQFALVESIVVEWSGGGSLRTGTGNRRGRSGQ